MSDETKSEDVEKEEMVCVKYRRKAPYGHSRAGRFTYFGEVRRIRKIDYEQICRDFKGYLSKISESEYEAAGRKLQEAATKKMEKETEAPENKQVAGAPETK